MTGEWNVTVTNPGSASGTLANGFTVIPAGAAPTLLRITPDSGTSGSSVSIRNLTGTNFISGASVRLSRTGNPDLYASDIIVLDTTNLSCIFTLPAGTSPGAWDVTLTNTDGQSGVLPNGFTVNNPGPAITSIIPDSGITGNTVSITSIAGSGFQNGATVKLFKAASTPITGTVTSITAFDLSCLFNLNGKSDGSYNLIVTNPDGQSDSRQGIFTIGDVAPVIAGVYPITGSMNSKVPLTISGQNFRNEVKVSFMKNATELVCDSPLSMESSKISCTLDLSKNRGASSGEWNVTVINIRDGQRGTWLKKFLVTNATPEGD